MRATRGKAGRTTSRLPICKKIGDGCVKFAPCLRGGSRTKPPLCALRTSLDSWSGVGHVAVGIHRQGFDLQDAGRPRLARGVLHDRHGALSGQRDRHRVRADALARDAAGGVGRAEASEPRLRLCFLALAPAQVPKPQSTDDGGDS